MIRLALLLVLIVQSVPLPNTPLDAYINALGGEAALRSITTRVTEGRFDNGRGMKTIFRAYEKAPNKRLTTIGAADVSAPDGSARAYDGTAGWDKNFIGTGLRVLTGAELADLAWETNLLLPLAWRTACSDAASHAISPAGEEQR